MQEIKLPRRQYTEEFKIEAIRLAESIGGHEAARWLSVPVATVGNWKRRRAAAGLTGVAAPEVVPSAAAIPTRREAERGNPLKSDGVLRQRVAMKYAWIENHRDEYAVSRLCRVLSVSRSGYCQWRVRGPSARALASQALDARVAVIHRESRRSYRRPRIVQKLRKTSA